MGEFLPAVARGTGSSASEALQCGGSCGCYPSSASSGYLYEFYYSNDEDCWWIISGASPSVSFTSFWTEEYYDYVWVEECGDATCTWGVTQLAKLSGYYDNLATYAATGQYLRVRFESDGGTTESGFWANWISGGDICASMSEQILIDECTGPAQPAPRFTS